MVFFILFLIVYMLWLKSRYVQSDQVSGRITCGIWGYITAFGPGEICETSSRMDSCDYTGILEHVYIPTMNMMFGENATAQFEFMQDNAGIMK